MVGGRALEVTLGVVFDRNDVVFDTQRVEGVGVTFRRVGSRTRDLGFGDTEYSASILH